MKVMKLKTLLLGVLLLVIALPSSARKQKARHEVLLETTMGNIRIALYNETPHHRDNFLRLVKHHQYDGLLFHRVIKNFMIQGGDPMSRNAKQGELLGDSSIGKDDIKPEYRLPQIYHKRGALAQAREGDDVNPERLSSGSQFYIVYGHTYTDEQLDRTEKRLQEQTKSDFHFTPEMRETYKTIGGSPHLDGLYTVYGEVVEGMDTVEKIQNVARDKNDRPLEDVRILSAKIIK